MTEILKMVTEIKDRQDTIDMLLSSGILQNSKNNHLSAKESSWYVEGIYADDECAIAFGNFPGVPKGTESQSIPHTHQNNKEYLIVVRGAVALFVHGEYTRTLQTGDVGIINPNEHHFSIPLKKDTKLISVCVPADKTYHSLFKKPTNDRTDNS